MLPNIERIRNYLRYRQDRRHFLQAGGKIARDYILISDFTEPAGAASGHYFHQDLLVAQFIASAAPRRHIDVGSRIDGFVAHVASFRKIEIADIRKLNIPAHPNIQYVQADLMRQETTLPQADSVSCLHTIEHFGLGRYGDPIDVDGHLKGFANLLRMLKPGGSFYISFPIADKTEVHFNAHRLFHPKAIFAWPGAEQLALQRFDWVDDYGDLRINQQVDKVPFPLRYGCGIYSFKKVV